MSNARYNAVANLRASLILRAHDAMAMLTVYCDDSGTDKNSRVAVVAGYLSNVAQWELFSKEWRKALDEFGIDRMRRADLENFRGEFKKWNPERRIALLQRLQPIIKRRTKLPIASVVIKEDFERAISDDLKEKMGGVYGFLAYICLVSVGQWCGRSSRLHGDPIQWVFESGTEGSHQVSQMFDVMYSDERLRNKSRLGGWSFQGKELAPLQSADLLAYECFKHIENQVVDRGRRSVRISWGHLVGSERCPYMKFWEKPWLEKFSREFDQRLTPLNTNIPPHAQ